MNIVIAGKNNIAVSVTAYIKKMFPKINLFSITNENDAGIDGFQFSYKKYINSSSIPEITLLHAYEMDDSIFLSLEFDKIVNPERFKSHKIFNIHFSLLPKYKGMYTSAWPILNGEKTSGVTFHEIDLGIDTGNILDQIEFPIEKHETAKSLYLKYIDYGTKLVIKNLSNIIDGDTVSFAQLKVGSSYYSKKSLDYKNITVDYNKTAWEIRNQIYAYTFRDYQLVSFYGSSIFGIEITNDKSGEKPGTILKEEGDYFLISSIDFNCILFKDALEPMLNHCKIGDKRSVVRLSENRLLVNEKNSTGWSPIIVAAYFGQLEIIKYLVSLGANINDVNYKGTTVLMYAKDYLEQTGDEHFIDELIRLGADATLKDQMGLSIQDYVRKTQNIFSLKYFG